jgi:hypothetical protein
VRVAKRDDVVVVGPGFQERQRRRFTAAFEQVLAGAGHYRVDKQAELIEQTLGQQEPDEGAAGADGDVLAVPG